MKSVTRLCREYERSINLNNYIELDDSLANFKNVLDSLNVTKLNIEELYSPALVEVIDSSNDRLCVDYYTDVDTLLTAILCSSASNGTSLLEYLNNVQEITEKPFEDGEGLLTAFCNEVARHPNKLDVTLNNNKTLIRKVKNYLGELLDIKPRDTFNIPLDLDDTQKNKIKLFAKSITLFTILPKSERNSIIKGGYLISGMFPVKRNQGDDYCIQPKSIEEIMSIIKGRHSCKYLQDNHYIAFLSRRDIRVSIVFLEMINDIIGGIA